MSRFFHRVAGIYDPSSHPSWMKSSREYREVSNEEGDSLVSSEHAGNVSPALKITTHARHGTRYIPALLWALGCGFLAIGAAVLSSRWSSSLEPQLVYSPAQEALRFHTSIYPDGFKEITHFMGAPSPTIDNYWEQTYDLPSRIPKWQADKLSMPTMEIPGDEGYYVVLLDVFHSLHCLNEIRKSLHPEYYAPYHLRMNTTEEKAKMHLDHCVEHVRLSLWCNADISPISYHRKPDGSITGMSGYKHMCRDARSIIGWAREHKIKQPLE